MSDVPRVLQWFETDALLRPDAAAPNTVDLSQALLSLTGAPGIDLTPNAQSIASMLGQHQHYIVVLVDGLGMNLIESLGPRSLLRANLAMELRSVFPSSTAPSLTSIATGLWPAQHAACGWFSYLPDAGLDATMLPFQERYTKADLRHRGLSAPDVFPVAAAKPAYRQFRVHPKNIDRSVYSLYSSNDAPSFGYTSLRAAISVIEHAITSADGPTSTYFYIPFVDTASHERGLDSKEARRALKHTRTRLEHLVDRLAGTARIVITADHGQIVVPPDRRHMLPDDDPLLSMLKLPPTCEPRVPAFHVVDGAHGRFEAAFRERFGGEFALLTVDQADELRLFGPEPLSPETRRRLGDYIALSDGPAVILHRQDEIVGYHGGLLPDEVRIPLIVA